VLGKDELGDYVGTVSVATMRLVDDALVLALALPPTPTGQANA
jgi:mRNA interferase MazF